MAAVPSEIEALIALMARLPGLGPRSARRAVLHMIRKKGTILLPLSEALSRVGASVRDCLNCGNIATEDICPICADPARGTGQICVVAEVPDLWAMERAGAFSGRYHVLGGLLSALDGLGPEELRIPRLMDRLIAEGAAEAILALPATVDGQTTAHYIAGQVAQRSNGIRVTTLAQGVPMGGELDYLDDGTIGAALRARRAL